MRNHWFKARLVYRIADCGPDARISRRSACRHDGNAHSDAKPNNHLCCCGRVRNYPFSHLDRDAHGSKNGDRPYGSGNYQHTDHHAH